MVTFDAQRLARLTGSDRDTVLSGLQGLSVEQLEHENFLHALTSILRQEDVQLRHLAAHRLNEAAHRGIDISHALSALELAMTDDRIPKHLAEFKNPWHTIGALATGAIARIRLKRNDEVELRRMLAEPGWPGVYALSALQSATESEIEPYLPLLDALLSADEAVPRDAGLPSKQQLAARVLATQYLRRGDWTKLGEMMSHPSERARKGVVQVLDDAAEAGQPLDLILPALLATFERTDAASVAARSDAAAVLQWFVLREKKRPKSFVLHGVDILKIPEVRAKLAEVRRFGRKLRDER
jgi:hypothetical protein